MKLICLNVALFETNNKLLSEFFARQNADILCLQEVSDKIDASANVQYVSKNAIDEATSNLQYSYFGQTWSIKEFHLKNFHKKDSFDYDFGGFIKAGNYLKSRFAIVEKKNVFVTKNRRIEVEPKDWALWPQDQVKAVLVADLKLPSDKKLRILNYHGVWTREKLGNAETLAACKQILKLAKAVNYPTIIAGDFNLFPDTPSMKIFYDDFVSLIDTYNIQTTRPNSNELSNLKRNVVDFVLVSKDIKVNNFEVPNLEVSDHLPLILDFEI